MDKKTYTLIAIAVVLAGVYAVCFTGWFRPRTMLISHTTRQLRFGRHNRAATERVYFGLNGDYSLTDVKVVPLAELRTNQFADPIWHLVSDKGSAGVSEFFYGQRIRGMAPFFQGARPEPLHPGVTYRLFLRAGKITGRQDFQLGNPPAKPSAAKTAADN